MIRALRTSLRLQAICAVLLLVALRIAAAFVLPVNSDEPQHLHVVWAWTQGLLPYRDVFDNHMPLYQWLSVPALAALGERDDIVVWMRLAQLPIALIGLWLTYAIGARLWNRRVGVYAVLVVSLWPAALAASTEYRPDVLWSVLWLGAVAAVCSQRERRGPIAALLLGLTIAVSLKSSVLLASGAATLAILVAVRRLAGRRIVLPTLRSVLVGAILVALPAAIVVAALAALGVLDRAWYCIVAHNVVTGLGRWDDPLPLLALPAALCLLIAFAWRRERHAPDGADPRRGFVALWPFVYLVLLYGFWPLVPKQDWLPVWPLLALALGGAIEHFTETHPLRRQVLRAAMIAVAAAALAEHLRSNLSPELPEAQLARVLRLTRRDDYVMDAKGESVFRRRPFYYALEGITRHRMQDGSIADSIVDDLMATRTAVVLRVKLPNRDAAFVEANYLDIGDGIAVAGLSLHADATIDVAIETRYGARCGEGLSLSVDGVALAAPRELRRGTHEVRLSGAGECSLVWATALEREPELVVRPLIMPRD